MADYRSAGEPVATVLDVAFDADTLQALRAWVRTRAGQAGLPGDRAEDVVLAVHELAANAVHHGAGTGCLRLWYRGGELYCRVEDGDLPAAADPAGQLADHEGGDVAEAAEVSGWSFVPPSPGQPGHGLWVVRQVADRMQVLSGPRGTRVTLTFNLPGRPGRHRPQI